MTNEQMKEGRFFKWANYRKMIANIQATLVSDGVVIIATHLKKTQYDKRHADMFKANQTGAFVQRGKNWDCITFSSVYHYRRRVAA